MRRRAGRPTGVPAETVYTPGDTAAGNGGANLAGVEQIWIETTNEYAAFCVLGALSKFDARMRFVDGSYQVSVTLEADAGELLRTLHRSVQKCLDENGIESVVFHLGQQAFDLRASA